MAAGRKRALERRRVVAIERVALFNAWSKKDVAVSAKRAAGIAAARIPMPCLPTSQEYALARGDDLEDAD